MEDLYKTENEKKEKILTVEDIQEMQKKAPDLIEKINQKTEKIDYIEDNYAKIEFTYE